MAESPLVVLVAQAFCPDLATASFDTASPHDQWSVGCISIVAESPHVMFGAQAFCPDLAAASFNRAYGYPRPVGGIAIFLPLPNVMLVAQAVLDGLATASFDAASPHYLRFVGCISVGAASPLVVFTAQAFCVDLAAASLDCAYGCPRSVGGIAIVAASPLVVLEAQTFTTRLGSASFDVALNALRYAQAAALLDQTLGMNFQFELKMRGRAALTQGLSSSAKLMGLAHDNRQPSLDIRYGSPPQCWQAMIKTSAGPELAWAGVALVVPTA